MSRLDEYEYRRGPVRRKWQGKPRVDKRKVKGQMALFGTAPDKQPPAEFNDDIDHIGR